MRIYWIIKIKLYIVMYSTFTCISLDSKAIYQLSFTCWFCNPVPNCKNESNIGLNQIEHQHNFYFFSSKNSNAIKSEAMILWKSMSLMEIPGLGMRNPTMRKKDNKETHWHNLLHICLNAIYHSLRQIYTSMKTA